MLVMSPYRLLIGMAVNKAIFGCWQDIFMWFMAVTAINFCHGPFRRDLFMTGQTLLFFGHCRGVSIYMTAQARKTLHADTMHTFVFMA